MQEELKEPKEGLQIVAPFWEFYHKKARYKVAYGGRGGAKSENIARILLLIAYNRRVRILCTRQFQTSIKDSVYKLLSDIIGAYPVTLAPYFTIYKESIVCTTTGSEFIFKGLQNISEIKSMQAINYCWVEEAACVTAENWEILIPTIRYPESEIWISFNPMNIDDPTYKNFIINKASDDQITLFVNYWDNPFFPAVLQKEMEQCKKNDYDLYLHIWEGQPRIVSDAQVFKGKYEIKEFTKPESEEYLLGADWGFGKDPATLIAGFIYKNNLYIEYEAWGKHVEIRHIGQFWKPVLQATNAQLVYADQSRPETISDANQYSGVAVVKAENWANSIKEGLEFIRGKFEKVYIHPRCVHTIEEFKRYSYKVNKVTQEVTTQLIDNYNHCIDAIRYMLSSYIKGNLEIDYEEVLKDWEAEEDWNEDYVIF